MPPLTLTLQNKPMRCEWYLPVLLAMPFTSLAGDTPSESQFVPPAYKVLRFDEDYSCLSNPTNRTGLADSIKYISLRTNLPAVYLTLGGELRERFEGNYNPNFGIHGNQSESYWLQRITFLGDVHLGERVRIFAEGISGLESGQTGSAPPVQQDRVDLQFAFADVVPYLTEDERLTARAGRFGMSLGSGRLVATRAAPNIPFRFDGGEAIYSNTLWEATGFLTRPVKDTGDFSGSDPDIAFWGVYATHWLDASRKIGVDAYYLGIDNDQSKYASGSGHETRHSFGARIFGSRDHWDWNGEGVVQTGTFGDESILAWTTSLDSGYTWEGQWRPRLGLKVDVASGDSDPNDRRMGTFNALYFKSGYFNDASVIRPANLIDVHPNLAVNLTRALSVNGGADVFWRYSQGDAIYGPPGFVTVPALRTGSDYAATALDVNLQWQINRHLTLGASFVHFFAGSYMRAAHGSDLNFVSTTLSCVF